EQGRFAYNPAEEDIHSQIQSDLKKLIGAAADKLHAARSRNDLIALDMKLYCRDHIVQIGGLLEILQEAIVDCAQKYQSVIIPAYTHLQAAQLISAAHHLLAYVEMIERDKSRLIDCAMRLDQMPLGSCALSGTSLPIDRGFVAKELGFSSVTRNSMDSVSDRDFIIELLADLAIVAMHFSRIAEDMILWASS
ncbi:MAG: argininosuccinate lyase, partial [Candidatus Omnitrophica bacterium CG12_big_fil_rev_8_21_14_0_65_50_5]